MIITMQLCSVCSRLDVNPASSQNNNYDLGSYEGMAGKARRLGPGPDGCAGCAFFCDVINNSSRWHSHTSELSDCVVSLNFLWLDVKTPDQVGSRRYCADDLLLDICSTEVVPGMRPHTWAIEWLIVEMCQMQN